MNNNFYPDVLISIHPKWAKLIYEGKKNIEVRKRFSSLAKLTVDGLLKRRPRIYFYETAPVQALTGYAEIVNIKEEYTAVALLNEEIRSEWRTCMSPEELKAYAGENSTLQFIKLKNPKYLRLARSLPFRPPQSWQYMKSNMAIALRLAIENQNGENHA